MDDKEKLTPVYSYHTFMFPFLLNWEGKNKPGKGSWDNCESYKDYIKENNCWTETTLGDVTKEDDKYIEEYATYRYFNNNAKDVLTGKASSRFIFKQGENSRYRIYYNKSDNGNLINGYYDLKIRQISLNICNSCVAVLRYELSFDSEGKYICDELKKDYVEDESMPSPDDVNRINENGRRVYIPYIESKQSDGKSVDLNAKAIHLIDPENGIKLECSFEDIRTKLLKQDSKDFREDYKINYIPNFITELINFKKSKTTEDNKKRIKPVAILDDRMFVGCLIRDEMFIETCKEYLEDNECYGYMVGPASEKLYQLCYIETDMTCQSKVMRKELMKKTIYDRWIDYGTLHGVTHHSFVCLTSPGAPFDAVILPFITSYMDMAEMVLIQRATLLTLSNYAADISSRIPLNGKLSNKLICEIQSIHGKFIKYKNQILLFEVTPQEQGIELFDRLRNEMYIEKELERVDDNIQHLDRLAESEFSNTLNKIMFNFAAIAIAISLATLAVAKLQTLYAIKGYKGEAMVTSCILSFVDKYNGVFDVSIVVVLFLAVGAIIYWFYKMMTYKRRKFK